MRACRCQERPPPPLPRYAGRATADGRCPDGARLNPARALLDQSHREALRTVGVLPAGAAGGGPYSRLEQGPTGAEGYLAGAAHAHRCAGPRTRSSPIRQNLPRSTYRLAYGNRSIRSGMANPPPASMVGDGINGIRPRRVARNNGAIQIHFPGPPSGDTSAGRAFSGQLT